MLERCLHGIVSPSMEEVAVDTRYEGPQPDTVVERLVSRSRMHLSEVLRAGDVVIKDEHPWTRSVHSVLDHLHRRGFRAAPAPVGSGFTEAGREMVTYIPGVFVSTGEWSLEGPPR